MSSYSSTYPSVSPTYQIDFANGGRIPPNATFSRSDSPIDATKAAASAVHFWSNEKHLSSENLIPYSNLSSGFSFGQTALDSTNNSAPDGGSDAVLVLETAVNSKHEVYRSFSCTSGTQYSFLLYVKANGRDKVILKPQLTSVIAQVRFDLTAVTSTVIAGSADSHSITAIGSTGWYKCVVTATATATGTGYTQVNLADSGGSDTYLGDVTKGAYLWGAQVSSTGETVLNETSGQIARSYASTLKSVGTAGQPRFEYGIDGQSGAKGILIEGQSNNLALNSEDFSNASWNKIRTSVIANSAISPSGDLTADLLMDDGSTATSHFVQPLSAIATGMSVGSSTVSFSVYAKSAGRDIRIVDGYQTSNGATAFNLTNGTVISGSGSIESCGNGWYRCSTVVTIDSSTSVLPVVQLYSGSTSYDGDSYSGALLWGFQVENGSGSGTSFASSYIATTSSTVTRAQDSLSVATADIPDFSEGVGTVVYETGGVASATETNQLAFGLNGPASSNFFTAGVNNGGVTDTSVRVYSTTPAGDQAFLNPGTATVGTGYKLAVRYELDNIAASMNGGTVVSDTSGQVPVGIDTLWVGELDGNYHLNSNIKRIALYNEALSDTNLQALTS